MPRIRFRLAALLGLAGAALLLAPAARAEPPEAAAWRDAELLARHLEAACEAVEVACGAPFETRPDVRVSTQRQIDAVLARTGPGDTGLGEIPPAGAREVIAYFDPLEVTVHVNPDAMVAMAAWLGAPELLGEDLLRIILVHEATHALDFERFPVRWTLACCAASDERLATEATLEGHAQLVAEEISRRWGIEEAFQRLTRLYTGSWPRVGPDGAVEALGFDQEAAFVYLQGHAFMSAVRTAGGRGGLEAVLRDPPTETRVIDRPILWLQPELRGREVDLQALLEAFRPLVRASGWQIRKWRVLGPSLPEVESSGARGLQAMEGYVDNHGMLATSPDGHAYVNVFLAHCRTERDAGVFVEALRDVDRGRGDELGWTLVEQGDGAGSGGRHPGFHSLRRPPGAGAEAPELSLQVLREGRYVIELSSYAAPGLTRAAEDGALALAVRMIQAPAPAAPAVALRSHVRAFLQARAAGRLEEARVLMRDLLPTSADLRRVVAPERSELFAASYEGPTLQLRTTRVPDATLFAAFREAGRDAQVRAWGATTESLVAGGEGSDRFPPEMREFARAAGAPGTIWLALFLRPDARGEPSAYHAFARLGDRFLWIRDPWQVLTAPDAQPDEGPNR